MKTDQVRDNRDEKVSTGKTKGRVGGYTKSFETIKKKEEGRRSFDVCEVLWGKIPLDRGWDGTGVQ